jgi:hypothetical protein
VNDQGERGERGIRGERGLPGESGIRGLRGARGPAGQWPLSKKLSVVLVVNVLAVVAIAAGLVLSVVSSNQARTENCERVVLALDVFTDALVGTAEEAPDPEVVEAFRESWHDPLEDCA